ncbi:gamma-butyrobetaine hydroxylase-like domain-containing protein [Amphritea sp. HPY]|uniref:gamma-butyrobetaine hydroxylase-like domain-containing protein n=1 Tax=Amphritea sp. HPY TaxID=3421652 RepID=UPI003D7E7C27
MAQTPLPQDIKLHTKSRTLELIYSDSENFELTAEYLRVHSPSAEVRGHGRGNGVLQTGKQLVGIKGLEPSGNYALKIIFDDGHDSGLYTWEYLYDLCHNHDQYWNSYLKALEEAGETRNHNMIAKG